MAIVIASALALGPSPLTADGGRANDAPASEIGLASIPTLSDNQQISEGSGSHHSVLTDTVVPGNSTGSMRIYSVYLRTTFPLRTALVNVSTGLLTQAADPGQIPSGSDVLPPAANWSWQLFEGSVNDTGSWNLTTPGVAYQLLPWANATFTILGTSNFSARVTAYAGQPGGGSTPSVGMIVHTPSPRAAINLTTQDPHVTGLLGALRPALVRWSLVSEIPTSWNVTTGTPTFHLAAARAIAKLIVSAGAVSMLDVPAGSWGDGNTMPAGMPLNLSIQLVSKGGGTGYFPALAAYHSYLTALIAALAQAGIPIAYWNIGNEVPVGTNLSTAAAFTTLYNQAAAVVHNASPTAKVSSDVFVRPNLIKYFATKVHGADFLDFHYYPANGPCPNVATFCAPDGIGGYQTDPAILSRSALFAMGAVFPPPAICQLDWYNGTHTWVPLLDTESNLNAYPNAIQNSTSIAYGSDPRQQTLFAAAWLDSAMMDAAATNVSAVTYFALQGPYASARTVTHPYGGWGYSMISGPSARDQIYAPYWAADLWQTSFPTGSRGLFVNSSDPFLVHAYAVGNSSGATVLLANRNALPTTIRVNVSGAIVHAATEELLDATTYQMSYDAQTHSTTLSLSRVAHRTLPSGWDANVTIDGYGIAVIQFAAGAPPVAAVRGAGHPGEPTGPRPSPYHPGTGAVRQNFSTLASAIRVARLENGGKRLPSAGSRRPVTASLLGSMKARWSG